MTYEDRDGFSLPDAPEVGGALLDQGYCTIQGLLYDLGEYPGLKPGEGSVIGELFEVRALSVFHQLDEYERYAVALVDKEKARFFSVFLGEIDETDDFKDFVPAKHDQGGVSQANFQRHHEAHVFRHLKRVERAVAMAGSVEVVHGEPAERLLQAGGGLGALLRYTVPVT